MNKRIELRSNFAHWFGCTASQHEKELKKLRFHLKNPRATPEKRAEIRAQIAEHQKIVNDCREEQRRYNLQSLVCGNEVLTVR